MLWAFWIGVSLVYTGVYWHLAALSGHLVQGIVLASGFLLQALLVGAYAWRERFTSCAQAAIQSASAAVAVVGLPAGVLVFTLTKISTNLHSVYVKVYPFDLGYVTTDGLQFGFVATVLLMSGIADGTALGILRWSILQAQPAAPGVERSHSWWNRYSRSAMPWAASLTLYEWVVGLWGWNNEWPPFPHLNDRLLADVLLGIAGLFSIALVPILSRTPEPESRTGRLLRYLKIAMLSIAAVAGVASIASLYEILPVAIFYYPGVLLSYGAFFFWPCLLWAVLYEYSRPQKGNVQSLERKHDGFYAKLGVRSNGVVAAMAAAGQACALCAGLLATAPASLGMHGIGCSTVNSVGADTYWFWKAYKGLGSEVQTDNGMVLRPSVDASVCLTLNERATARINDPKEMSKGYVAAVYVWTWLMDPEQWESTRTRQIRRELTRLLGRDFSSYEDLKEWGRNNSRYLEWSGTGELLEVPAPEDSVYPELAGKDFLFGGLPIYNHVREPYYLARPDKMPALSPVFFSLEPLNTFPALPSWNYFPVFGDREARLRGLKLDAASSIDIVSGGQQRRVQEYLHDLIGGDFSNRAGWQSFFAQSPRPNPWRVRRREAEAWITLLHDPGSQKNQVRMLQASTGLSYSSADDFIEWLQSPQNTRYDEWEVAESVFRTVYDDPDLPNSRKPAMDWLTAITGQTFDSPEQWVQWWQANRTNLALSDDGRALVVAKK